MQTKDSALDSANYSSVIYSTRMLVPYSFGYHWKMLCSTEESKSYRFKTTWGWVNNGNLNFWVKRPFNSFPAIDGIFCQTMFSAWMTAELLMKPDTANTQMSSELRERAIGSNRSGERICQKAHPPVDADSICLILTTKTTPTRMQTNTWSVVVLGASLTPVQIKPNTKKVTPHWGICCHSKVLGQ